jgi:hypothetical protein
MTTPRHSSIVDKLVFAVASGCMKHLCIDANDNVTIDMSTGF